MCVCGYDYHVYQSISFNVKNLQEIIILFLFYFIIFFIEVRYHISTCTPEYDNSETGTVSSSFSSNNFFYFEDTPKEYVHAFMISHCWSHFSCNTIRSAILAS